MGERFYAHNSKSQTASPIFGRLPIFSLHSFVVVVVVAFRSINKLETFVCKHSPKNVFAIWTIYLKKTRSLRIEISTHRKHGFSLKACCGWLAKTLKCTGHGRRRGIVATCANHTKPHQATEAAQHSMCRISIMWIQCSTGFIHATKTDNVQQTDSHTLVPNPSNSKQVR